MSNYGDGDTAITRDPMYGQSPQGTTAPPPPQHYGYGYGYGMPPYGRRFGGGMGMHRGWSETKPFYMTSEFLVTLLGVIGIAITASIAADLDSHRATALIAGLLAAYTLSRGIAKAGTRSRASDPRDEIDLGRSHDGPSNTNA